MWGALQTTRPPLCHAPARGGDASAHSAFSHCLPVYEKCAILRTHLPFGQQRECIAAQHCLLPDQASTHVRVGQLLTLGILKTFSLIPHIDALEGS